MLAQGPAAPLAPEPDGSAGEAEEPSAMNIYWPVPVEVQAGPDGVPSAVESVAVNTVREEWLVEDRWWTPRPLRRRYFELVLADGRNVVVFCEPAQGAEGDRSSGQGTRRAAGHPSKLGCGRGRWFLQRA